MSVETCRIEWRALQAVIDGEDSGRDPDVVPIEGMSVIFTPSVDKVVVSSPPQTIFLQPIVCTTNSDGYLVSPDNEVGVSLVASNASVNPTNFTYKVAIKGPPSTPSASVTTTFFATAGDTLDISTLVPVSPSGGETIADWVEQVNHALSAASEATTAAATATTAATTITNAVSDVLEAKNSVDTAHTDITTMRDDVFFLHGEANRDSNIATSKAEFAGQMASNAATSEMVTAGYERAVYTNMNTTIDQSSQAKQARDAADLAADRAEDARDKTEAEVVTGLTWAGAVSLTQADAPRLLHATLTGDVTITLPTPASNRAYTVTLLLKQDATGGRTVKIVGGLMSWAAEYVHTGTANSVDMLHLLWSGTNWIVLPGATNLGIPASWVV